MTFEEFLIKYNGAYVDFDGYYGAQCMDLMHQYIYDVLGLTDKRILAAPTAKDVFLGTPFGLEYFDKIPNTPTGVPKEGDIIFFGTGVGPAGHVCIFISGDANKFQSFDVNWPVGSPAHVQDHTYGYCLGWLSPKGIQPDLQTQLSQSNADRDRNWTWFASVCKALGVEENIDAAIAEATKNKTLAETLVQKEKQLMEVQKQANDLQAQLSIKEEAIKDVQTQVITLTVAVQEAQKSIDSLTKQTKEDQVALEDLKVAAQITKNLTGFRKWIFERFIQ